MTKQPLVTVKAVIEQVQWSACSHSIMAILVQLLKRIKLIWTILRKHFALFSPVTGSELVTSDSTTTVPTTVQYKICEIQKIQNLIVTFFLKSRKLFGVIGEELVTANETWVDRQGRCYKLQFTIIMLIGMFKATVLRLTIRSALFKQSIVMLT